MMSPREAITTAATESLRRTADTVERVGLDRWTVKLAGGERSPLVTVIWDKNWLRFETAPGGKDVQTPLNLEHFDRLLLDNAGLRGGAKFGLDGDSCDLLLTAEIPLHEDVDLVSRVREVCAGLRQGMIQLACKRTEYLESQATAPNATPKDRLQEPTSAATWRSLIDLCTEAGWPCAEHVGGRVAVRLESGGAYCRALLESSDQTGTRVRVVLGVVRSLSEASRLASALLLLSGCRVVRLARATIVPAEDGTTYGWEVMLGDEPAAEEMNCALVALSIACRLTARELRVLEEESVAKKYLATRGWSSLLPDRVVCS
ncbi:MAG TPA: hypothetical protein DD670_03735 [Planctomycetaceae bacterium]|nr:hypothetical protein [Planctomycetaceae bacterium]